MSSHRETRWAYSRDNVTGLTGRGLEAESSGNKAAWCRQDEMKGKADALLLTKTSNLTRHWNVCAKSDPGGIAAK